MTNRRSVHAVYSVLFVVVGGAVGCAAATPPPAAAPVIAEPVATPATVAPVPPPAAAVPALSPTLTATKSEAPALSPPIDEKAVADATGVEKPEKSPDGTVKASFPRKDVDVVVDGWKMPPFMGLTSWAAFAPGRQGVADAMVMGDFVLFEDEVNAVMSRFLQAGIQVTALHNHFFYESPKVFFMHIGGEGKVEALGQAVRGALNEIAAIRKKSPKPGNTFGAAKLPSKSALDSAKLDALLDIKGQAKDGMYKAVWGRDVTAACGCSAGKAMGVNTWAGFAGVEDNALVDGDFAVSELELQTVLKTLRSGGINIVAIHSHMTGESPRILFLHYWGRGKVAELAGVLKKAIDQTAWAGKGKTI